MAITLHRSHAIHPGRWLRSEIIEPLGLTSAAVAQRLGASSGLADALLRGDEAISPDLADRLEEAFSIQSNTLLAMQRHFDEKAGL
nr:HigA family addiction module antitoxin [uncultured Sphingomonas sp.]